MVKRLLSAQTSEVLNYSGSELKQAIKASEGRIICCENVGIMPPIAGDLTNAEVAAVFGADLILMNGFDLFRPIVQALNTDYSMIGALSGKPLVPSPNAIEELKALVGRPLGVNLEPVDPEAPMMSETIQLPEGHQATERTLLEANRLGVDFICLTGNPGTGVTNSKIVEGIKLAKKTYHGLVIAGKMHSSGVNEAVMTLETAEQFISAGTDVLLVPAVGTVPGFTDQELVEIVRLAKDREVLTMSAIGTSQEGADTETIRQIALRNKVAGVDIQHLGDAGYFGGMASVDNIYAMSMAIRGIRHTINRMARSVNR